MIVSDTPYEGITPQPVGCRSATRTIAKPGPSRTPLQCLPSTSSSSSNMPPPVLPQPQAHNSSNFTVPNSSNKMSSSEELAKSTIEGQDEDKGSPKEMAEHILNKTLANTDIIQVVKSINIMSDVLCDETLKHEMFFEYYEITLLMVTFTEHALDDADLICLNDPLSTFYRKFCQACYFFRDNFTSKPADIYTIKFLDEGSSKFVTTLQSISSPNPVSLKALPLALNAFLMVGITFYQFKNLETFFRNCFAILNTAHLKQIPLDTEDWREFCYQLHFYFKINAQIVGAADRFRDHVLQEFVILLVEKGLVQKRTLQSEFCLHQAFHRLSVRRALKDLKTTLQLKSTRELFLFFQKEISDLLTKRAFETRDKNPTALLIECMSIFGINQLPKELLRWVIPPFVVRMDSQTEALFRENAKFTRKEVVFPFQIYLADILIYIFYDCSGDCGLIFQVFKYFSTFCEQDLFRRLVDDPVFMSQLFENFTESCLKRYSANREATLRALSFIYNLNSSFHLDLKCPDMIREVKLDSFKQDKLFVQFLRNQFPLFMHQIDQRIEGGRKDSDTWKDKLMIIRSYSQLMAFVDEAFVNKFRHKIYFTIKLLFGCLSYYAPQDFLVATFDILAQFIQHVNTEFLQIELPSIFVLISPLLKMFNGNGAVNNVLEKVFARQYPKQIYHQLYFIPDFPVFNLINEKIKRQTGSCALQSPIPVNLNFNNPNQVIEYVKTSRFGIKCQEFLFVLDHVNNDNEKIQEVSLRRILELLTLNKDLFYHLNSTNAADCDNLYEDLSEVNLTLLPDGYDGANQYLPHMFALLQSIETVSDFFRCLVFQLLRCLKFSTGERRNLAATCLGALGAISPKLLGLNKPSLTESFQRVLVSDQTLPSTSNRKSNSSVRRQSIDESIASAMDFCNRRLFRPQSREFKQLVLESMMTMVKRSSKLVEFRTSSFVIQELMDRFVNAKQCLILDKEVCPIDDDGNIQLSVVENFVNQKMATTANSGSLGITGNTRRETERLQMLDELEKVLETEKIEPIKKERDLSLDLIDYSLMLDQQSMYDFSRKKIDKSNTVTMERFFAHLNPAMSYHTFLHQFLRMLYQTFILDHAESSSNGIQSTSPNRANPMDYHQIFSQHVSQAASMQGTQFSQEFTGVMERLKSIQTPMDVFLVCYHSVINQRNMKLAYLLVPSLLVLALSLAESGKQEEFARQFRSMVQEKFLLNPQYFCYELGQMASELICFIYDFLVEFDRSRKVVHQYVVPILFMRNRVQRFDAEYSGVKVMLKFLNVLDVARLSYASGSYHRALYYIERSYDDLQAQNVSPIRMDDFVQENLNFLTQIYGGLNDTDSVKGCTRLRQSQFGTLDQLFNSALMDDDHEMAEQVTLGAKVMKYDHRGRNEAPTMDIFDAHVKHFQSLSTLDIDLTLFAPKLISDTTPVNLYSSRSPTSTQWSSTLPLYMIESAWRLGTWQEIEPIVSATHFFSGIPNSELSKLEQNNPSNQSNKNQGRLSLGSDSYPSYFAPNIGHVLLSLFNEEAPFVLDNKIIDIRNNALAPLSAALLSNHQTAYSRSYLETIVSLHTIHDVQHFAQTVYVPLLGTGSAGPSPEAPHQPTTEDQIKIIFREVLDQWKIRNRILPLSLGPSNSESVSRVFDVQRTLIRILQNHCLKKYPNADDCFAVDLFRYWNDGLRVALECGHLDRAYTAMLEGIHLRNRQMEVNNRQFALTDVEHAHFVMDAAKVYWFKKDSRAALKLLKSELDRNYSDIKYYCCLARFKQDVRQDLAPNLDLVEIAGSLGLKIPTPASKISSGTNTAFAFRQLPPISSVSNSNSSFVLNNVSPEKLRLYAEIQLQFAQYCDESRQFSSNPLMTAFRAVTVACPKWEEGHYAFAVYCSNLIKEYQGLPAILQSQTSFSTGKSEELAELKNRIVKSLAESLKHGNRFVSVSLPMLLNTWIDGGYELNAMQSGQSQSFQQGTGRMSTSNQSRLKELQRKLIDNSTVIIRDMTKSINSAVFLLVIDTLITHMLHPNEGIGSSIRDILAKLIADFPHHMAWQFSRSSSCTNRRGIQAKEVHNAAIKLLDSAPDSGLHLGKYFASFRCFTNYINELARYKPPKQLPTMMIPQRAGSKASSASNRPRLQPATVSLDFSLRKVFPNLVKSIDSLTEFRFMMPCNRFFLPSLMNLQRTGSKELFDQFYSGLFIEKLEDTAQTMKSLQMPKKITFLCSDGIKRILLCKSFDDLRKDRCMLNFCNLFNQCYGGGIPQMQSMQRTVMDLKMDAAQEAKILARRKLNPLQVQTYFVCALSDSFGIIEWINGLQSMKSLIEGQYNRNRASKLEYHHAKSNFVKNVFNGKVSREKRIENFIQNAPKFCPPVFQLWFQSQFADSFSWYMAKKNFTRTSAVYSVLGYTLGLGDRHAENMLLNPCTGEVVQVDFNCLFNRGEEFLVPECVPFRLTHNMLAGMGVIGYEGQFRHTCEDVLLVLRQYRKLFSKYVTIFLYDPLAEWMEGSDRHEMPERSVFGVEARLCGVISRSAQRSLPKGLIVSVEGQIDYTLKEATDLNNLGAMYHGWASYI